MANVEHVDYTGTNLHEPKGISTASAGSVYIADGAGSGRWTQNNIIYLPVFYNGGYNFGPVWDPSLFHNIPGVYTYYMPIAAAISAICFDVQGQSGGEAFQLDRNDYNLYVYVNDIELPITRPRIIYQDVPFYTRRALTTSFSVVPGDIFKIVTGVPAEPVNSRSGGIQIDLGVTIEMTRGGV